MAKKAKMANIASMRGINIFKDGIPGAPPEPAAPEASATASEQEGADQPEVTQAASHPAAPPAKAANTEKKTLRSYHLTESVISKLEDAHMVYSLKKIDKSKQDIVAEALEKHFADLEEQGFFQILDLLRN